MNTNQLALAAAAVGAALLSVTASSAHSAVLDPGQYVLLNHPSESDPSGLRLDELYNVNASQQDIFLFDFEHLSSLIVLHLTGSTIRISGQVHGGYWREGVGYVNGVHLGVYTLDMFYDDGLREALGDDDLVIDTIDNSNTGTIITPAGQTIPLYDERGTDDFSLRIGDENSDQGHRGFDGVSGWGWLNHGSNPALHRQFGDFLFAVGPLIPAPGAGVMAVIALGVLASRRRR